MTEREKLPKLEVMNLFDDEDEKCVAAADKAELTREQALEVIRRAEAYEGLCAERDALREALLNAINWISAFEVEMQPTPIMEDAKAALAKSEKKI